MAKEQSVDHPVYNCYSQLPCRNTQIPATPLLVHFWIAQRYAQELSYKLAVMEDEPWLPSKIFITRANYTFRPKLACQKGPKFSLSIFMDPHILLDTGG